MSKIVVSLFCLGYASGLKINQTSIVIQGGANHSEQNNPETVKYHKTDATQSKGLRSKTVFQAIAPPGEVDTDDLLLALLLQTSSKNIFGADVEPDPQIILGDFNMNPGGMNADNMDKVVAMNIDAAMSRRERETQAGDNEAQVMDADGMAQSIENTKTQVVGESVRASMGDIANALNNYNNAVEDRSDRGVTEDAFFVPEAEGNIAYKYGLAPIFNPLIPYTTGIWSANGYDLQIDSLAGSSHPPSDTYNNWGTYETPEDQVLTEKGVDLMKTVCKEVADSVYGTCKAILTQKTAAMYYGKPESYSHWVKKATSINYCNPAATDATNTCLTIHQEDHVKGPGDDLTNYNYCFCGRLASQTVRRGEFMYQLLKYSKVEHDRAWHAIFRTCSMFYNYDSLAEIAIYKPFDQQYWYSITANVKDNCWKGSLGIQWPDRGSAGLINPQNWGHWLKECSNDCHVDMIRNNQCDRSCNLPECEMDGSDCLFHRPPGLGPTKIHIVRAEKPLEGVAVE